MTIKTSGTLSMQEINAEFGLGTNLYAYRGVKWYRDDNSRGYFDQAMGNNPPIDMLEFYGKRKTIPVVASGPTAQANGSYFSVPFYNKITITITGGSGGQAGAYGINACDRNNPTPSGGGGVGGTSSFGGYGSAVGGGGGSGNAGGGSVGQTTIIVFDAEADPNAPLKGIPILNTIGAGGAGGRGGPNGVYLGPTCYFPYTEAATGATGSPGSITIKVE